MVLILRFPVQLMLCQMFSGFMAKQCSRQTSVHGMMLERHIFKVMETYTSLECLTACHGDKRCQSFNYVVSNNLCELNNRTKEARPEDFVPNPDRYYYGRFRNRVPLGSIRELPAESCKEIKASEGGQTVSGNYWFKSNQSKDVALVHCDMKTEDIDECEHGIHDCPEESAICLNTIGSYSCVCKDGYQGDGKNICTPEECLSYSTLTSGTRKITYSAPVGNETCDRDLSLGWFRFQGDAGSKMPTECVPYKKCGTDSTGWLKGGHPTVADGKVAREVCFRDSRDCCKHSSYIEVRNCGSFFVYQLTSRKSCNQRYCSTE